MSHSFSKYIFLIEQIKKNNVLFFFKPVKNVIFQCPNFKSSRLQIELKIMVLA